MTKPLFEEALDDAVLTHFGKLFATLMLDPSAEGMKRFQTGLAKLTAIESSVRKQLGDARSDLDA